MSSNLIRVGKLVSWLIVALAVLLLLVLPLLTSFLVRIERMPLSWTKYLAYVQTAQMYLISVLGAGWLFFLGSCFASFLNVVAWRVPRGRGINGSSMCPVCDNQLRFSDNLPIFGWLRNSGQCRSCRMPISPRYLIVELILGSIFLVVSSVEILGGGINLPLRPLEHLHGFEHLVFSPKWDLIQLTVFHLVLICLLFTFALIRSERLRIPMSIFATGLILGIGLPLIWPSMLLVDWRIDSPQFVAINRFSEDQWLSLFLGMIGGLASGLLLSWATRNPSILQNDKNFQSTVEQFHCVDDVVAGMLLVGLFLGWQSAFSVALILFAICVLAKLANSAFIRRVEILSAWLLVATLIHLLGWRFLNSLPLWPGPSASNWVMAGTATVLVVAAITLHQLTQRPHSNHPSEQLPQAG